MTLNGDPATDDFLVERIGLAEQLGRHLVVDDDDVIAIQLFGLGEAATGIEIAGAIDGRPVRGVADDLRAARARDPCSALPCSSAAARRPRERDGSALSTLLSAYVRRGLCRHLHVSSVPSHASNVIG